MTFPNPRNTLSGPRNPRRIRALSWSSLALVGGLLMSGASLGHSAFAQNPAPRAAGANAHAAPQAAKPAARANVSLDLSAFKVVSGAGGEKLVSAARISPGEVIEYQVRYVNSGGGSAKNLQAVLPIPDSLQFVSGSASPASATASLDGKSFAAMPLMRSVRAADGSEKNVPVPAREYRYLRWNVANLSAGQSVRVSARAQLADLPKTEAASASTSAQPAAKAQSAARKPSQ